MTEPQLESAKILYAAGNRAKALVRGGLGWAEPCGSSTATVLSGSVWPMGAWEPEGDARRAITFGEIGTLIGGTVSCLQPLSASGTFVIQTDPTPTLSIEIGILRGEKQALEDRIVRLERDLEGFRPYVHTIQRLAAEYAAATGRVRSIVDGMGSTYRSSGALERARELDAFDEPISEEREEIS